MKRIAIAISFVCCTAAHAEFWDGNYLHEKLNGTQADQHIALGYIMGVSDTLFGAVQCAPSNVTGGQVRDMVRNYINNTPAIRHRSADSIVTEVLKTVWPCQERRGRGQAL
jgi:hypothetical protein